MPFSKKLLQNRNCLQHGGKNNAQANIDCSNCWMCFICFREEEEAVLKQMWCLDLSVLRCGEQFSFKMCLLTAVQSTTKFGHVAI